jgi:TolA-binding protein
VDVANIDGHARKTTHMTCEEITQHEIMERYLLGRLEQPARDAFDEHLFECEACFERLQTLRAVRRELAATAGAFDAETERAELERARRGWIWKWALVPAFATLIIVSVIVWPRVFRSPVQPPASPTGQPRGGSATATPGQVEPGQAQPGQATSRQTQPRQTEPRQTQPGQASSGLSASASSTAVTLAELGRFEPPPFTAGSLRGSQDASAPRFREGMTQYARGDYRGAIAGLRAAARLDPEAAHAAFFLGICHVLSGEHDEGIRALRQTIQLGDSPFLEEAHFYLAKALLQQNDPASARQELMRTIELKGPLEQQARQLLADLDRTQVRRP